MIMKEAEKILKYKDPIKEIQRIWGVKANMIPVIAGATGTISKSLRQYLSHVPGKHEIKELQKNIHFWHCTHTAESTTVTAKVKVKLSRYRPGVTQKVGRGIALLFHDRGTRKG